MTSPVLVTGGTGTLGRLVVARLRDTGRDVRVLSRNHHDAVAGIEFVVGDLANGEGVGTALDGVETVIHLAGTAKGDEVKAPTLVQAATPAGLVQLVFISVVGADRIPIVSRVDRAMFGYFGAKLAAERIVAESGLPFSTLRATQFHASMLSVMRQMAKLPVIPAPAGVRFQPIDAAEVAARLVDLAVDEPAGLVPEVGGPRVYEMADLVRGYLRATHRHRPIMPVRQPGGAARAFRDGANLAPERAVGRRTWEDFLAERVAAWAGPPAGAVRC